MYGTDGPYRTKTGTITYQDAFGNWQTGDTLVAHERYCPCAFENSSWTCKDGIREIIHSKAMAYFGALTGAVLWIVPGCYALSCLGEITCSKTTTITYFVLSSLGLIMFPVCTVRLARIIRAENRAAGIRNLFCNDTC